MWLYAKLNSNSQMTYLIKYPQEYLCYLED